MSMKKSKTKTSVIVDAMNTIRRLRKGTILGKGFTIKKLRQKGRR